MFILYFKLRNLIPTKKEIETLKLEELFAKHKKLSYSNICATVSDDDFVDPVPPRTAGASSSLVPAQYKSSLRNFQNRLSRLEAGQKSLISEVENLKTIVKEQRAYIDSSLSTLRDTLLKKVYSQTHSQL